MIKRLFIVLLGVLAVIFIPYYVGDLTNQNFECLTCREGIMFNYGTGILMILSFLCVVGALFLIYNAIIEPVINYIKHG